MPSLAPYRKTIAAVVTGVLGWVAVVITSNATHITASEWLLLGTNAATALGVFGVANEPPG
jgi:hypothetical protein